MAKMNTKAQTVQTPKAEVQDTGSKRPTHRAYTVRNITEEKSWWSQVGAAWAHKDGKGFNVTLFANPVDGKVVLTLIEADESDKDSDIPF